jgi:hypothetical protein
MTAERHIDYEALAQGAMRGIVRTVLGRVAKSGLPGEHHFYIAFNTEAPGVVISKRLKQKYPEEMTVVLQHRFWDLTVTEERFEVKLTFDGIPERLSVPFTAVKVFFDPSVPYGLQFEESEATESAAAEGVVAQPVEAADGGEGDKAPVQAALRPADKKPRAVRKPRVDKPADDQAEKPPVKAPTKQPPANADDGVAPSEAKVVSLDKFRKK